MKSKAVFLLVIFLLHTIVGFGCVISMETHKHGINHNHPETAHSMHHHVQLHQHQAGAVSDLRYAEQDLCCKVLVNDLVTQSKLLPEAGKAELVLPVMWLPDYAYVLPIRAAEGTLMRVVGAGTRAHVANQDIRIRIRSFQI